QRLGLGVEQRVLDRTQRQRDHTASGWTRHRIELGVEPLVLADRLADQPIGELADRRADTRRAEALVVFAPPDDAVFGRHLDEVVVAPARIGRERLDRADLRVDFHRLLHLWLQAGTGAASAGA